MAEERMFKMYRGETKSPDSTPQPGDPSTKLEANDDKWNNAPDPWNRPFPKQTTKETGPATPKERGLE